MAGRNAVSGLPSGSSASSLVHARERVGDPPERRRPGTIGLCNGFRDAQRDQAGAQQFSQIASAAAAKVQLRPAAGKHVAAKLRPPFQPVGGTTHSGAVEQLLSG